MTDFDRMDEIMSRSLLNFTESIVNDAIKKNVDFRAEIGMRPKIVRTMARPCCEWCSALAGTYFADEAPEDIYRRHDNCDCVVMHISEKGVQNAHTKEFLKKAEEVAERKAKIEELATPVVTKEKRQSRIRELEEAQKLTKDTWKKYQEYFHFNPKTNKWTVDDDAPERARRSFTMWFYAKISEKERAQMKRLRSI